MTLCVLRIPQGASEGAMPERPCPSLGTPRNRKTDSAPRGVALFSHWVALTEEGHTFQVCLFLGRLAQRENRCHHG